MNAPQDSSSPAGSSRAMLLGLAGLLVVAGIALTAVTLLRGRESPSGGTGPVKPVSTEPLKNFELTDLAGMPFDSKSLKGKVWVASFFYSSCPSECVLLNRYMQSLQIGYGGLGLKTISISIDPKTDTQSVLRDYAQRFSPRAHQWYFLRGDMDYIQKIGVDLFKLPVKEKSHSDKFVVVDRKGVVRGWFSSGRPEDREAAQQLIEQLLEEPEHHQVGEFKLTERNSETFDSKSLLGKIWVASFFFSSCPGPCTTLNRSMEALQRDYAAKGVYFVSISCDPQTDTPSVLRDYADRFNADKKQWLFLTGTLDEVLRVGHNEFDMPELTKKEHGSDIVLVNRQGGIVGRFLPTDPLALQNLRAEIDKLLQAEPATPTEKASK